MQRFLPVLFLVVIAFFACKEKPPVVGPPLVEPYYFPPVNTADWETNRADFLNWDTVKLNDAFAYAGTKNTYGLIVLQNGKIVKEQYWNNWNSNTRYPIFSAGKSVVAFLMGIGQQEGILNINDKSSQYLGTGWTSLPVAKENLITLKHQLSMTTGLDDGVADPDCEDPACLIYKADAGTRWAYHNAPYRLLQDVIANASGQSIQLYSKSRLYDRVGMSQSLWFNNIMFATTRDAARFGSLIMNKGVWDGDTLLYDRAYFDAMTNTSQNINLSYGYLWWLNGKTSCMVPGLQTVFNQSLSPSAPQDMIMALGKDDKKIYIVPSLKLVVVRLGDAAGTSALGPSSFDNEFWTRMKASIRY